MPYKVKNLTNTPNGWTGGVVNTPVQLPEYKAEVIVPKRTFDVAELIIKNRLNR